MTSIDICVDVQNAFTRGPLAPKGAGSLCRRIADRLERSETFVVFTVDDHTEKIGKYEKEQYGEHCNKYTDLMIDKIVEGAAKKKAIVTKSTFTPDKGKLFEAMWRGGKGLPETINVYGLLTDVCVLNIALMLRNELPNTEIVVIEDLCLGSSLKKHNEAISILESNSVKIGRCFVKKE